jgi:hypothetical protein
VGTVGTIFDSKENSMNWLKLKLRDWVNSAQDTNETIYATKPRLKNQLIGRSDDIDSDAGLNITVRRAIGGKIITFRHYDVKTDRSSNKLYIVPDELDFERELGKMITLESMRG